MIYTNEELNLALAAFSKYTEFLSYKVQTGELNPEHIKIVSDSYNKILNKMTGQTAVHGKPDGISEEYFNNVCKTCKSYKLGNCEDKIALKFPGKCDPILKFEQIKKK